MPLPAEAASSSGWRRHARFLRLLTELDRNPSIATVVLRKDFSYRGSEEAHVCREYWVRVSQSSRDILECPDDLFILRVHYAGDWNPSDDQATLDRKTSVILQMNVRYTCDGSGRKFPKPCQDPGGELDGKWLEEKGTPVLDSKDAPDVLRWRDPEQRNLADRTPILYNLLMMGEGCTPSRER
jgi:hypothetical protein